MADAGGRFTVISAAEIQPIRRGSALVQGRMPRNKFSPPSPRRIPRQRHSDPIGPTWTQADSIGVCRGIVPPPRLGGGGGKMTTIF